MCVCTQLYGCSYGCECLFLVGTHLHVECVGVPTYLHVSERVPVRVALRAVCMC